MESGHIVSTCEDEDEERRVCGFWKDLDAAVACRLERCNPGMSKVLCNNTRASGSGETETGGRWVLCKSLEGWWSRCYVRREVVVRADPDRTAVPSAPPLLGST